MTDPPPTDRPDDASARLTPRERQVLILIARGLSNVEVAAWLGVAPVTLRSHVRMAYRRIGVTRRVDAALWVHRHGLLDDGSPLPEPASFPGVTATEPTHPWGTTGREDASPAVGDQHRNVDTPAPATPPGPGR